MLMLSCLVSSEAELAPKREGPPGEATALEALLRGDNLLEKKNSIAKEEETLLEIQVCLNAGRREVKNLSMSSLKMIALKIFV